MSSQPNVSQDMHFITDCRIPFLFLLVSSTQDFHPDIPRGKKELIPQAWVISETNQDPQKKDSRRDEKGSVEPKCPVQPLTIDWLDNVNKYVHKVLIIY